MLGSVSSSRSQKLFLLALFGVLFLTWKNIASTNDGYAYTGSRTRSSRASGPFQTATEYRDARQALLRADIQSTLGLPLTKYSKWLSSQQTSFFDHLNLPNPPAVCRRFYTEHGDDDYPVAHIDLALARMMGSHPSKIPTTDIREVTHKQEVVVVVTYVLRDGVLYFDTRAGHPQYCVHRYKILGTLNFLVLAHKLQPLPDVAFRFSCVDNPVEPLSGLWTYSSLKDPDYAVLSFPYPDGVFNERRWHTVSHDETEVQLRQKPRHAEWRGTCVGLAPMPFLYTEGHLEAEDKSKLEHLEYSPSRPYFRDRYRWSFRVTASCKKKPMKSILRRNRVLFSLAGQSAATVNLELLLSNSVVAMQDYPNSSWEDHFFDPGVHYVAIPRSLDDAAVQRVLDAVFDNKNLDVFTNMTRLASSTAEIVANDDELKACYTIRAVTLWQSLLDKDATAMDEANLIAMMNLTEYGNSVPLGRAALEEMWLKIKT
jgi:hypothetical protein